jgi:hypothetical protein
VHAHPLSLYIASRTKLSCMLQLRGQIHSPYFYSTPIRTLWSVLCCHNRRASELLLDDLRFFEDKYLYVQFIYFDLSQFPHCFLSIECSYLHRDYYVVQDEHTFPVGNFLSEVRSKRAPPPFPSASIMHVKLSR